MKTDRLGQQRCVTNYAFVALFVYCIKKKKKQQKKTNEKKGQYMSKVHYKTAVSPVPESRPFCVCREPAVLVPLVTGATLSSWASAVESVSFEC